MCTSGFLTGVGSMLASDQVKTVNGRQVNYRSDPINGQTAPDTYRGLQSAGTLTPGMLANIDKALDPQAPSVADAIIRERGAMEVKKRAAGSAGYGYGFGGANLFSPMSKGVPYSVPPLGGK